MKIVPHVYSSQNVFLSQDTGFNLNGRPIGVAQGWIVLTPDDKERMDRASHLVWEGCSSQVDVTGFTGFIRIDLVPEVKREPVRLSWNGHNAFDYGPMNIKGVYEANMHAIECMAADAAMRSFIPGLLPPKPNAAAIVARALIDIYGQKRIAMVVGDGPVKQSWCEAYIQELIKCGVNLVRMTPVEAFLKNPSILYRFGDARGGGGHTEFHPAFTRWLRRRRRVTINTVPCNGDDPSSKALLMPNGLGEGWSDLVGDNMILDHEVDLSRVIQNKGEWVIKPLRGASGRDVYMGWLTEQGDWEDMISRSIGAGFGIYEARPLPKLNLPGLGDFAIDMNPAYLVVKGNLERFMYAVSRIDSWPRYWSRGAINVAQGAGYAGTVIIE